MSDVLDFEIWAGILTLTAILYLIKYLQSRKKQVVYRISPDSLDRSKKVILSILPLVEDEDNASLLDERRLPYSKEHVKNAAKILAYYYWKKHKPAELARIKNVFISLCRFQNTELDMEAQARVMSKEQARLTREFEHYMTHSPLKTGKGPS